MYVDAIMTRSKAVDSKQRSFYLLSGFDQMRHGGVVLMKVIRIRFFWLEIKVLAFFQRSKILCHAKISFQCLNSVTILLWSE